MVLLYFLLSIFFFQNCNFTFDSAAKSKLYEKLSSMENNKNDKKKHKNEDLLNEENLHEKLKIFLKRSIRDSIEKNLNIKKET